MRMLAIIALLTAVQVAPAAAQRMPHDDAMKQARKFLAENFIADGHNDVPWEIRQSAAMDVDRYDLRTPAPGQTDIARLRAGGVGVQFWSVYVPGEIADSGFARVQLEQIDIARRMIARYPEAFVLATSVADIEDARRDGKIASLIGMEGGHAIENSLGALRMYYALGARYMTLTHNVTLDWADAAMDVARHGGLTDFGRDVVREMNRIGMIVDLSHVSPGSMSDALDITTAPVMFSHSSARAVTDVPRNVPDSILKRMQKNGGVVMVTFVGGFISKRMRDWSAAADAENRRIAAAPGDSASVRAAMQAWRAAHARPHATVGELVDHIEHVRRVAGIDHVGLGGDYDGTSELPEGMGDVSTYPVLFAELIQRGWKDDELRKLANGNILRVLKAVEAERDRLAAPQ
ncbi:MAG: membrane dipeptidase [Gemmatimonadales bacterium]|nr:membrane dipeptidase [Gemmatimonadales bacterium]